MKRRVLRVVPIVVMCIPALAAEGQGRRALVHRELEASAVCTQRACEPGVCCNACSFRGWVSKRDALEAVAENGSLPKCKVDGCGRCSFMLNARGYLKQEAFVAVTWKKKPRKQ